MINGVPSTVTLLLKNEWEEHWGGLHRGHYFHKGILDDPQPLSPPKNVDQWIAELGSISGFFSFILPIDDGVILTVDHMRSIPLYYRLSGKEIMVTDNPKSIFNPSRDSLDVPAALDFLCTGYATGANTLFEGIKQVEPGTSIIFRNGGVERINHFAYRPCIEQSINPESYNDAFLKALEGSFHRLREVARGNQIALPLSGGFDSRLIALCLKKFGFENVLTFSYGRPGNRDSVISKKVAQDLGFDWFFVPYSNELWANVAKSKSWMEFSDHAFQLSSIPHLQDFPAVEHLIREGVMDANATLTPGHRPEGVHLPRAIPDASGLISKEELITRILAFHYQLWDFKPGSALDAHFRSRLYDSMELDKPMPRALAASIDESWFLRERESKFIVHSVRCYEHFGLNWWLPLLDKEFVTFWAKTSFSCKEKRSYDVSVSLLMNEQSVNPQQIERPNQIGDVSRLEQDEPASAASTLDAIQIEIGRSRFINNLLTNIGIIREKEYLESNHAFFGLIDKKEFMRVYTRAENINSFIALDLVKDFIDPSLLGPSDKELFRSIPIFKSDMLAYLEKNHKSIQKRKVRLIK